MTLSMLCRRKHEGLLSHANVPMHGTVTSSSTHSQSLIGLSPDLNPYSGVNKFNKLLLDHQSPTSPTTDYPD